MSLPSPPTRPARLSSASPVKRSPRALRGPKPVMVFRNIYFLASWECGQAGAPRETYTVFARVASAEERFAQLRRTAVSQPRSSPTCAPTLFLYFSFLLRCSWVCLSAPCFLSTMPGPDMLGDAGPRAVHLFLTQGERCFFLPSPRALRACRLLQQSSGLLSRSGDLRGK